MWIFPKNRTPHLPSSKEMWHNSSHKSTLGFRSGAWGVAGSLGPSQQPGGHWELLEGDLRGQCPWISPWLPRCPWIRVDPSFQAPHLPEGSLCPHRAVSCTGNLGFAPLSPVRQWKPLLSWLELLNPRSTSLLASGGGDRLLFPIKNPLEGLCFPAARLPAGLHSACGKEAFHNSLNIEGTYKCSPVTSHCRCFQPRGSDNQVITLFNYSSLYITVSDKCVLE